MIVFELNNYIFNIKQNEYLYLWHHDYKRQIEWEAEYEKPLQKYVKNKLEFVLHIIETYRTLYFCQVDCVEYMCVDRVKHMCNYVRTKDIVNDFHHYRNAAHI